MGTPQISPKEAKEMADQDQAILVDVREAWELQEARIQGALHIPLMELQRRVDELPKEATLIMVCKSGARSMHAAHMLHQMGYADVLNLAHGIIGWYQAGLPLEMG